MRRDAEGSRSCPASGDGARAVAADASLMTPRRLDDMQVGGDAQAGRAAVPASSAVRGNGAAVGASLNNTGGTARAEADSLRSSQEPGGNRALRRS